MGDGVGETLQFLIRGFELYGTLLNACFKFIINLTEPGLGKILRMLRLSVGLPYKIRSIRDARK